MQLVFRWVRAGQEQRARGMSGLRARVGRRGRVGRPGLLGLGGLLGRCGFLGVGGLLGLCGVLGLAAALPGCSSTDGAADDAAGVTAPGRSVVLAARDGGLALRAADDPDAPPLFSLAATGLEARTFDASYSGVGAIAFAHDNLVVDTLSAQPPVLSGDGRSATVAWASGQTDRTASLSAEVVDEQHTRFVLTTAGAAADSVRVPIRCDALGTFHGFGEQYNATNQRGEAFELLVNEQGNGRDGSGGISVGDKHTTYFPMPWYIDARGWGVLFDTQRRSRVDLCASDADIAWIEVIGEDEIGWTVFHGPRPLDVITQLGDVVGRPQQPPSWAWKLWIGSQGGRAAVEAEADALEAAGIPTAALWVQDWGGIRANLDGGFGVEYVWRPDEELVADPADALYPGFAEMVAGLQARGYRFLVYANPFIPEEVQPARFDAMAAGGFLVKDKAGQVYRDTLVPNLPQTDGHPDFGHPGTVDFIAGELGAIIADFGVDGWMLDFGEWVPLDGVHHDGSHSDARRNTFPVDWNRACKQAAAAERPDGDFVWFARSGYTGVQGQSMIHWVGDQETNWDELDGLPTVVPAMLNLGLAGQPFVTHDIAGFAKGTPSTQELWMRWTELGAFTPAMRTHEGADKLQNHSWETNPATTDHFRRFVYVHCALAPTFEALAAEAVETGAPLLRHMMLVFPDDPAVWDLSDQFMIGADLLVAPVLHEGATSRQVYLPAGTWYDVWTGDAYEGGQTIDAPAPIGAPPVFSRGADRADLREAEATLSFEDCR